MNGVQTAWPFAKCRLVRGPQKETLAEKFSRFDWENPQVFEAIRQEADERRRAGRSVRVKRIIEDLRDDPRLQTNGKPWKINNSYASRYARKLIEVDPRFKPLIELREMK